MSFKEWKKYKLGDFAEVQNGYAFKAEDFSEIGIPVIKIKNIVSPNISLEDAQCYNKSVTDRLKQFLIKKDDVLISMTGSHINQIASAVGKVGKYQFETSALLNQRVGKVYVSKQEVADEKYLFYYLSRYETQFELASSASGSANQANISPSQIKNLDIFLPPKETQKRISLILSSLDDKIELNRQTNKTLETIAQTLFKEMCLPKGEELPDGWKAVKITDIGKVITGKTPSSSYPEDFGDKIPFVTPTDFKNYDKIIISALRYLSDDGISRLKNKLLPKNSIIVTCIGSDMGKVAINRIECITNQQINSIIAKDSYVDFIFYSLLNKYSLLKNMATGGSTMPMINKSQFESIELIKPTNLVLESFARTIKPLNNLMELNTQEIKTLTTLRDSLLPKLMKGEIEV